MYTKGKWELKTGDRITAGGKEICSIPTFGIPYEEQMANAHLIAAAPTMREALKAYVEAERGMKVKRYSLLNPGEQALALARGDK